MVTLEVCVGSACYIKGSYDIISALQDLAQENNCEEKLNIKAALCLGHCGEDGISSKFEDEDTVYGLSKKNVKAFFTQEVLKRI